VASGFDISVEPDGITVEVSPGYALDSLGRELISDRMVRLTDPARCAQASSGGESWIVARWAEQLTAPAPLSASGQEVTRIREYAHIEVRNLGPEPESADLVLAKLTYEAGDITLVFRSLGVLPGPVGRSDAPGTARSVILEGEGENIDGVCTTLVRVIRRCFPAPPYRARWPTSWPCSGPASPHPHSQHSSACLLV